MQGKKFIILHLSERMTGYSNGYDDDNTMQHCISAQIKSIVWPRLEFIVIASTRHCPYLYGSEEISFMNSPNLLFIIRRVLLVVFCELLMEKF